MPTLQLAFYKCPLAASSAGLAARPCYAIAEAHRIAIESDINHDYTQGWPTAFGE